MSASRRLLIFLALVLCAWSGEAGQVGAVDPGLVDSSTVGRVFRPGVGRI